MQIVDFLSSCEKCHKQIETHESNQKNEAACFVYLLICYHMKFHLQRDQIYLDIIFELCTIHMLWRKKIKNGRISVDLLICNKRSVLSECNIGLI